jgi:hypothetical protein
MIKNAIITVCTLFSLLLLTQIAQACSCSYGGGSIAKVSFSSDAVFVGKVIEIKKREQVIGFLPKGSETLRLPESAKRGRFLLSQMQIVKFEVIEPLKGVTEKTIQLATAFYNGGGSCGVNFKSGESYLIFADKKRTMLSKEEEEQPKENWTEEMLLKSEADKFNAQLPPFETNICMSTGNLKYRKEVLEEIHNFLKNGVWNSDKELPKRILY